MADSTLSADLFSDLPPRTWRGWWLAWPKWLRIGCWAGFVLVLLQVALAVRMAIGLIEDKEISNLRASGGEVFYHWRNQSERFTGDWLIMDGLMGRSARNVYAVVLPDSIDGDTKEMSSQFPHLKVVLVTPRPRFSEQYLWTYQMVCHDFSKSHDGTEPVIIHSEN